MTAYDIPQLQEKYAELKHDIVVLQNENTLLKRKDADREYKQDELIHRIAKLEGGYNGLCDQIARLDVKVGLHLEDHVGIPEKSVSLEELMTSE